MLPVVNSPRAVAESRPAEAGNNLAVPLLLAENDVPRVLPSLMPCAQSSTRGFLLSPVEDPEEDCLTALPYPQSRGIVASKLATRLPGRKVRREPFTDEKLIALLQLCCPSVTLHWRHIEWHLFVFCW